MASSRAEWRLTCSFDSTWDACTVPVLEPSVMDRIRAVTIDADVPGIRLVGIDGPAGSGKSTTARALSAAFGWPVVEIDDFLSWISFDNWWPRFESEVLRPLLDGRSIRYQIRDWSGDEFGEGLAAWKELTWTPVVIVEGVSATRSAMADAFACRVWVHAPREQRLARGVARDGETHRDRWVDWMEREGQFFAADPIASRADVELDAGIR
jgi:dephospho-CoA kinase